MNIEAPPEETRGRGFAICLYLVAFVTGAIVPVDGGMIRALP